VKRPERLTAKAARRIALAAQGFADPEPKREPSRRHLARMLERTGLIQMDSVNVLVRAHYMPAFSRLGPYPATLLEDAAWGRRRTLFEYWGHEASLIPLAMQPLFRWRMAEARAGRGTWKHVAAVGREKRAFVEEVLREIERRGPMGAGDLDEAHKGEGGWWGWSAAKSAFEWLFWAGFITTKTRRSFERIYDLTERVLPRQILDAPTPEPADAHRELIRIASRAMGVATFQDLRDYFRMGVEDTRARVEELVEAGELTPVEVEGWGRPAYLHPEARRPRRVETNALLSPFDSLVWRRERAERIFDFRYRIEIYVPAHKREHGYYVLPFLQGERITARVDLKSDRAGRRLVVRSAHLEDHARAEEVAPDLMAELRSMAGWLELEKVAVEGRQQLAKCLAAAGD
jgi:uncharacterized protein YcaQ